MLFFYLFIFIKFNLNSIYFKTGLLILISIEIIASSYGAVNDRDILNQKSLEDKKGYFDYTNEAIAYLQHQDKTFYRVDKSYLSVFFKDPLMQNYYGVTAYNSLNNPGTIEFLKAMNVPFLLRSVNNIAGFDSRQILQTLVGVKYFLAKSGSAMPFGYEYVTAFGDVHIFKNNYSLPLGFTYDAYMTANDFDKLPNHQKDEVLLKAFVADSDCVPLNNYTRLSEKNLKNHLSPIQVPIRSQDSAIILNKAPLELFNKASLDRNAVREHISVMKPAQDEAAILKKANVQVSLVLISNKDTEGKLFWRKQNESFTGEHSCAFSIKKGGWKYYFGELYGSDNFWWGSGWNTYDLNINFSQLTELQLNVPAAQGDITLKNFQVSAKLPQDMTLYVEDIKNLKKNTMQIRKFSNDNIVGDILLDKNKLLFLSIPYDKGWQIKVDGKEAKTEKINIGFIGVFLNKGFHTVELKYTPPFLIAGMAYHC